MKKNKPFGELFYRSLKKTLLIMRMTIVLLILGVLQGQASDAYSQKTRISIDFSDAKLVSVLDKIEDESEFFFLYNEKLLDTERKVNIKANNQLIDNILENLFAGTEIDYTIIDRKIILAPGYLAEISQQQQNRITGTVIGEDGLPIPGVNVKITGTTIGAMTDIEGKYSIAAPPEARSITFSFIGMEAQEVLIGTLTNINVTLSQSSFGLDEVVVIGYGTQLKKDLTGSVASVSSDDVQKRGSANVMDAIQGQIAGVNISSKSGRAGGGVNIQIRGLNSLSGSSEPLYVVDGVVTGINFLNTADIARIDVLKDASSTAIYGSRGSNGVVIITTKNSSEVKAGTMNVSYDGFYGIRSIARVPEFMGGDEWLDWRTDAWMIFNGTDASNNPIYNYGSYGQDPTSNVFCLSPLLKERFQNKDYTDWFDLTTKSGSQQNHYVKIEGSSKTIKYAMGFGYEKEDGNVPGDDYEKYNFKLSAENQIFEKIKLGSNINLAISERNLGSNSSMASMFSPLTSPYGLDGNLQYRPGSIEGIGSTGTLSFTNGFNPILDQQNVINNEVSKFLIANLYVDVEIVDGLSFKSSFSPTFSDSRQGIYQGILSSSQYTKQVDKADLSTMRGMNYTWDNQFNYKKSFGQHRLDMMVMQNYYQGSTELSSLTAEDLPYNSLFYNMNNAKNIISVGSGYSKQSLLSYAGRANYVYKDRYYATATVRWDGSSKLANKWASFPSVALAWRLSEEKFMQFDALSNLKLRASYGYTGNNNNISPYGTMALATTKTYYDFGGNIANGFAPNGVINKSLTWERTRELDVAVDFGFFKSRINGSIDLYSKTSDGLLMNRKLPIESGWVSMKDNIGSVNNKGIEIALNTVNISTENFHWETSFTFAKNNNKILQLYGSTTDDDVQNRWFIGEPVRVIYGYVYDGVWTREEKELAALYGQREGMAKVKDFNATETNHSIDPTDRRILGSPMPAWTGSFSTNISYKNIDFSMSVFTMQDVFVFSPTIERYTNYSDRGGQKFSLDFYRPAGTPTLQPDLTFLPGAGNPSQEAPMAYTNNAGPWWHTTKNDPSDEKPGAFADASFVKVQNITMGYTFNNQLIERVKMKSLRLYLNIRNPFVFTKYNGFDPEWAEASTTGENAANYSTIITQIGVSAKF